METCSVSEFFRPPVLPADYVALVLDLADKILDGLYCDYRTHWP